MTGEEKIASIVQILEAITSNTKHALASHSINRLPSSDRGLLDKFKDTYAAYVFNFLRNQTSLSTILALSRVWDQTRDVRSIPHLLPFLNDATVIDAIIARRRDSEFTLASEATILNPGEHEREIRETLARTAIEDADRAECEVRKSAPILIEAIERFVNGELNASVNNLRNKQLAHSTEFTRAEMKAEKSGYTISPLTIGDIEPALRETVNIVTQLNLLIRELNVSLDIMEDVYADYAADFWARISTEPSHH